MHSRLEKFCSPLKRRPDQLAPHVRKFLECLDVEDVPCSPQDAHSKHRLSFQLLHQKMNSDQSIEVCLEKYNKILNHFLTQKDTRYDALKTLCESSISEADAERAIFNFLWGVQVEYEREPYSPKGGIITPDNWGGKTMRACYTTVGDLIVVTPSQFREFSIVDRDGFRHC